MVSFSKTELAWAAGFFDGEGCCFLSSKTYPSMRVSQATDWESLKRFNDAVGGIGRLTGGFLLPSGKENFALTFHGFERVQQVLCFLWPYLGEVKRDQTIKSLKTYREHITGNYHRGIVRHRAGKLRGVTNVGA